MTSSFLSGALFPFYMCVWGGCGVLYEDIQHNCISRPFGASSKNRSTFYGEVIFDHGVVYACISPYRTCNFLVVHHTMICVYFLYIIVEHQCTTTSISSAKITKFSKYI
jgi:hypothetical protein